MSFTCRDCRWNFTDPPCILFLDDLYHYKNGAFISTEKVDNHVCRRCNHPGISHVDNNRVPKSYSIHFPVNDAFSDFVPREIISIIFKLKLTDPLRMFTTIFCTFFRQYVRYQTQIFYIIDKYLFILKIDSYFIFIFLAHILSFILMTPIYLLYSLCVNNQIVSMGSTTIGRATIGRATIGRATISRTTIGRSHLVATIISRYDNWSY
ncbi:unnamed protein product [Rotaria magnacalcarata]|uniref:Uncharacterized protein n=1 Tax=Rotaria magnacalcarata TaxID=392030 RepID=A0A814Z0F9_9BILA|nr:unnamed protein product [Rotaria magnacalcarata]CAF1640288.1 unnamed protein product [Rotaria magnacalcarata]CAF4538945.1 unnamed protein product [Rotaria magnacalcarata]CAF4697959.1 unnamed protein product [Rotaria magnacalcarata]